MTPGKNEAKCLLECFRKENCSMQFSKKEHKNNLNFRQIITSLNGADWRSMSYRNKDAMPCAHRRGCVIEDDKTNASHLFIVYTQQYLIPIQIEYINKQVYIYKYLYQKFHSHVISSKLPLRLEKVRLNRLTFAMTSALLFDFQTLPPRYQEEE